MISTVNDEANHDTLRLGIRAAVEALGLALRQDLPAVPAIVPDAFSQDALNAIPQDLRRDLSAARSLYGVTLGPGRVISRRPHVGEVQTMLIPSRDGEVRIVVLCINGAAALYRIEGDQPELVRVIEHMSDDDASHAICGDGGRNRHADTGSV